MHLEFSVFFPIALVNILVLAKCAGNRLENVSIHGYFCRNYSAEYFQSTWRLRPKMTTFLLPIVTVEIPMLPIRYAIPFDNSYQQVKQETVEQN